MTEGGAVYAQIYPFKEKASLRFIKTTFQNNSASSGGAICILYDQDIGTLYLEDNVFKQNVADVAPAIRIYNVQDKAQLQDIISSGADF